MKSVKLVVKRKKTDKTVMVRKMKAPVNALPANIGFNMSGLVLPEPGIYEVEVSLDGKVVARGEIVAELQ